MADRDNSQRGDNRSNDGFGKKRFSDSKPARPSSDRSRDSRSGSDRPRAGRNDRTDRNSDNRPALERPGRGGVERERERPAWQTRVERPRSEDRPKSPMIPEEITEKDLDLLVRVQMKTLSPENAERVARHLAMVGLLINDDPELAHKHALAAADRAGRIGVVRETLGVTAYTVGDFALALRELQAFRRISGSNDQIALMVDSERGLGRPEKALELGRSVDKKALTGAVRANLAIAMSGARLDKAQFDLALTELEVPELNPAKVFDYSAQLFRAYAYVLELLERQQDAQRWYDLADRADQAIEKARLGNDDVIQVVEEISIPEPYEPRKPREVYDGTRSGERSRSRDVGNGRDFSRSRDSGSSRGSGRGRDESRDDRRGNRDERNSRSEPRGERSSGRRDDTKSPGAADSSTKQPWKKRDAE